MGDDFWDICLIFEAFVININDDFSTLWVNHHRLVLDRPNECSFLPAMFLVPHIAPIQLKPWWNEPTSFGKKSSWLGVKCLEQVPPNGICVAKKILTSFPRSREGCILSLSLSPMYMSILCLWFPPVMVQILTNLNTMTVMSKSVGAFLSTICVLTRTWKH